MSQDQAKTVDFDTLKRALSAASPYVSCGGHTGYRRLAMVKAVLSSDATAYALFGEVPDERDGDAEAYAAECHAEACRDNFEALLMAKKVTIRVLESR